MFIVLIFAVNLISVPSQVFMKPEWRSVRICISVNPVLF